MTFNVAVSDSYTCVVCKALWDAKPSVIVRKCLDYQTEWQNKSGSKCYTSLRTQAMFSNKNGKKPSKPSAADTITKVHCLIVLPVKSYCYLGIESMP